MIYLSGVVYPGLAHPRLGFLMQLRGKNLIPPGVPVAVDNGCFNRPEDYSDARYAARLEQFPRDRTRFATAPDVLGDHAATVSRSRPVLRMIRDLGLPAAFVAQDGWEERTTPWDEFDVLFIGGTTGFKFRGGYAATRAALRRGKTVHMGRVNSLRKLRAAAMIGCASADGTHIRFLPRKRSREVISWLDSLQHQPAHRL